MRLTEQFTYFGVLNYGLRSLMRSLMRLKTIFIPAPTISFFLNISINI